MKVGFIGFGTISQQVYQLIGEKDLNVTFTGLYDPFLPEDTKVEMAKVMSIYQDVEDMVSEGPDFVLEAANSVVGKDLIPKVLEKGIDVIALSTGAFTDGELIDMLDSYPGKLYLSGGALPCVDMIQSCAVGDIEEVRITTIKPPKGLKGAKGFDIDPDNLEEKVKIFDGTTREAIALFPKNVNVAVTISLAGIGVDRTKAVIYVDPEVENNVHEVYIKGDAGEYFVRACGTPSSNPRTSKITAFSVVSLIEKQLSNLKIG